MAHIPGMPETPATKLTYGGYLKVPELLTLQQPRSQPAHHDELLFIISHQVYELWFKQLLHELGAICAFLDRDQPLRAAQLFERVFKVQHLLIEQIPLLETMFSSEFARFRSNLGSASGFQSVQFRELEFFIGAKNPRMLELVGDDAAARTAMVAALAKPTPYDHFIRHLAREDNGVFAIPADALARDTSKPHEADDRLVAALVALYRRQQESLAGERYYAQFRVAEHLLEFEEKLAIWRFHHVKMVERMIGGGGGTGGSSGAKYLAATLNIRLYPDLWAVRDRLGAP
ncbi:MAG: tryptophan 2,3-dioxygenase [Phycisphaerales bacterium]